MNPQQPYQYGQGYPQQGFGPQAGVPQPGYSSGPQGFPQQGGLPQGPGGFPQPQGGFPQGPGGFPQGPGGFPQGQGGFAPHAPIEVSYVCDGETARRLTRGMAIINWRLPSRWGMLLILPAFLLARGTVQLLADGGDAVLGEMLGAFLIVLAFELCVVAVMTLVQFARVDQRFLAVAGPGHRVWARYTDDAMELQQTTGAVTNRYADIKRVIVSGTVVYVQPKGTTGFVLPREVVPDEAVARIRAARV